MIEMGERVAKLEQRADAIEREQSLLRSGHGDLSEKVNDAHMTAALVVAKLDAFLQNAEVFSEQVAYRVYARIRREEREEEELSERVGGVSAKLVSLLGLALAIIAALVGLKASGLLP